MKLIGKEWQNWGNSCLSLLKSPTAASLPQTIAKGEREKTIWAAMDRVETHALPWKLEIVFQAFCLKLVPVHCWVYKMR
jgi:hypothetical protein